MKHDENPLVGCGYCLRCGYGGGFSALCLSKVEGHGMYVETADGQIGVLLWAYEIHRPGVHDGAMVGFGNRSRAVSIASLVRVKLGPNY